MRSVVHADQRQFSLRDSGARLTGAGWTEAALTHRVGAEEHGLAIATARSDLVEYSVTPAAAPPALREDAEHVVEADVALPSGELVISGPADYPSQERTLPLPPGRYRVRVSYVPAGPPEAAWNDHEYGEHFRYEVDLWPSAVPSAPAILRRGASVWDG